MIGVVTHGQAHRKDRVATSEYRTWANMKYRCSNPKCSTWALYGGRGIRFCVRWKNFESFFEDMGLRPKGHSLERLDTEGDYSPENCIWATTKQQNRNRRNCKVLTIEDETRNVGEWAEISGVPTNTIHMRAFKYGWDPYDAVWVQVGQKKKEKVTLRCIDCGHNELYGNVQINVMVILKQKGGRLNTSGVKHGHAALHNSWNNDQFQEEKEILGPILCGECGANHVYVVGETPALRLGDYVEVIEMGKEVFLAQGD